MLVSTQSFKAPGCQLYEPRSFKKVMPMARYVISHRCTGSTVDGPRKAMDMTLNSLRNIKMIYDSEPQGYLRRAVVFECDEREIAGIKPPKVIFIKREIVYRPHLLRQRLGTI